MRKVLFLLITAVVISGAAWGQTGIPNAGAGLPGFDRFNAVPTTSTESRYSAGIFTSDVDDYIDVISHDPKIGTFFFLGGYPAGDTVNVTTDFGPTYVLNFGLGKTLSSVYLGVYYGGNFVNAAGSYRPGADPLRESATSNTTWRNRLAVLIDPFNLNIGAFRFDLIMDSTSTTLTTQDGELTAKNRTGSPSIALTWGGLKIAGIDPYVTIGYKLADVNIAGTYPAGGGYTYTTTETNGAFGIQAGGNYDLDENSSILADIVFLSNFATNVSSTVAGATSYKAGGSTGFGLQLAYSQTLDLGKVSVGFKPALLLGYTSVSTKTTLPGVPDTPSNTFFDLAVGIDLGVKYKHNNFLAFYTGAGLTLFDWVTAGHSGGDTKDDSTAWRFSGLKWDTSKFNAGGTLGFGMTVTPTENLIIGTGLNTFLDKLFTINLRGMRIETGNYFADQAASNNVGSLATLLLANLQFDLTVSYKF